MEVALFPIPDVVTFPGTVVPLHVFEPRYRQMVNDAVERNMMIGVCHTRKQIRAAKTNMTQAEALSTNQATYLLKLCSRQVIVRSPTRRKMVESLQISLWNNDFS